MAVTIDGSAGISTNDGSVFTNASGNVGIGTSSPAAKVDNTGTFRSTGATDPTSGTGLELSYRSTYGDVLAYNRTSSTFAELQVRGAPIIFSNAGGERMRIDTSGGLILVGSTAQKATGTTWSNPSDQRLKSNIQDYTKGTTELMQVRVREWEYNGKGGTTEGMKGLGVIADEVMTVLPNTVKNYDAKLNADDEETTAIKKFDATEITWLLVKTAQEQQALITALTARITALETP
jgi:hypothetical protein